MTILLVEGAARLLGKRQTAFDLSLAINDLTPAINDLSL